MQVRASGIHTTIMVGMGNIQGKPYISQKIVGGEYNLYIELNLMET